MNFADHYLSKQKNFSPSIQETPENDLGMIIVIPCFNEPGLITTLDSLNRCAKTLSSVEILIVFNYSETASRKEIDQNLKSREEFKTWKGSQPPNNRKFYYIWQEQLKKKDAGAGLARKIGMDEAVYRFNIVHNPHGIICSFDADATCDLNYLTEIEKHYANQPDTDGTAIYFEHPLSGDSHSEEIYQGIIQYELYLRYYKAALEYTGFPFAFHTVGSCFTVKASSYVKQGGMNRKQAGEDFYFIQKLAPLGNFFEINTTCVYPSSRASLRVPFGTGPTVKKISESIDKQLFTYNPDAFIHLKELFECVDRFYSVNDDTIREIADSMSESIKSFLHERSVIGKIAEINRNSASKETFRKRYYRWFNAFLVIKYLNFAHDKYYQKIPVAEAARELLLRVGEEEVPHEAKGLLKRYRNREKRGTERHSDEETG